MHDVMLGCFEADDLKFLWVNIVLHLLIQACLPSYSHDFQEYSIRAAEIRHLGLGCAQERAGSMVGQCLPAMHKRDYSDEVSGLLQCH